jgi:hypothetical protein
MLKLFMILYSIISNTEAINLVRSKMGVKFEELSKVSAVSYKLSDERVIILPINGEESLIFKNVHDYKTFLLKGDFPKFDKNPFIRFGNQLSKPDNFKDIIEEFLLRFGNAHFENDLKHSVQVAIDAINEISVHSKLDLKKDVVPIGLLLGNFLVKNKGFRWSVKNEIYQFTPYFLPIVEYHNGIVFNLWAIVEDIVENEKIRLNDFFWEVDFFTENSDFQIIAD